ncbi:hypothetical protein [Agreia sp. VKM Ac-1783]|uniref:hypothetical protein n=1 Tax=Agreia sp. VKM Ac-1783 TaxID=1938889 RepID=UPI0014835907|nr:hypothetical protein [Agreia sp. VKM Ac-1783]
MEIDADGLLEEGPLCSGCGRLLEPSPVLVPETQTLGIVYSCPDHGIQSAGRAFTS